MAPGQVMGIEVDDVEMLKRSNPSGWVLYIHPDFLWNTPLAKTIKKYEYFDYSVNEALFLSEKEEATVTGIIQNIRQEYHSNIDKFSQDIIISQKVLTGQSTQQHIHDKLIEKTNGDSEYNFITMAVWESEEAFANAGRAIWAAFQKEGFNPQEAHEKLRVKRIQSEYTRAAY